MPDILDKRAIPGIESPSQKSEAIVNWDSIVSARISPAIGIARIGDSEHDYFIGPEVPHAVPPPAGGYKDDQGRLKRQAAQFRVYGYNAKGEAVAELTAAKAEIAWTVHVANTKRRVVRLRGGARYSRSGSDPRTEA